MDNKQRIILLIIIILLCILTLINLKSNDSGVDLNKYTHKTICNNGSTVYFNSSTMFVCGKDNPLHSYKSGRQYQIDLYIKKEINKSLKQNVR